MAPSKLLVVALGFSLAARPAAAQQVHEHRHAGADAHGRVSLPISCRPELQSGFDHAVALLHSFGYEEARRGFADVARRDPDCGMAWWGVAMSYFHQHWDQPTPAELAAGTRAAQQAAARGARTERERAYIAAIGAFYDRPEERDHLSRARAYAAAMGTLAADHPNDHEASIFHALALLATRRPGDTTYANQKRAGEILTRLLEEHPEHPGIIHYIIHAFDYPELAELALPAARIYARIAPASPHALHMPSHIFTRLGLWEESIASNLAVARVAKEQTARTHPGAVAFENLHANDYLVYAYLQLGEDEKARRVVEETRRARRFDDPAFIAGYAIASAAARYAVERRNWRAAAAVELPAADLPWENFPFARGNAYYARAIGAARLGDLPRARRALNDLTELGRALAAAPPRGAYDWAGQVEAMRLAASGWLAQAEGRPAEAVRLLTEAADLEERVGKHPVTPGPILPAREQLGDLLLELKRAEGALGAYEATLADSPKRLNALAGAARAAELAGDHERAREYHQAVLALCGPPSCGRAEARRAAEFVNGAGGPARGGGSGSAP